MCRLKRTSFTEKFVEIFIISLLFNQENYMCCSKNCFKQQFTHFNIKSIVNLTINFVILRYFYFLNFVKRRQVIEKRLRFLRKKSCKCLIFVSFHEID